MRLSGGKLAISAGARGRRRPLARRACSLIVSLTLVTLVTIIHEPTLASSYDSQNIIATTSSNPTTANTTTTTAATTPQPISGSTVNATQTIPAAAAAAETTSQTPGAVDTSTHREPTEQEINEARKIIQEVASTIHGTNPHRFSMNKPAAPTASSLFVDYAPDSPEAKVSDATTYFGLSLMKAISPPEANASTTPATSGDQQQQQQGNTVVSPLSLQILLNIILLGTKDQSLSQAELAKVLGYRNETVGAELSLKAGDKEDANATSVRLGRPHQAMHSVVDSIMKATHLSVNDRHLLNTDPEIAASGGESSSGQQQLQAHLQTTARDHDTPLTGQVNFTLANLMLTNKDLVETSPEYEGDLKRYYNIKVEQFSRQQDGQKKDSAGKQLKLHERVNNWVKNITQNQITDLADEASLSDDSLLLVLLNAAHFKGRWLHTFHSRLTQNGVFYNNGRSSAGVDTKFMRQNGMFGYAEFNGYSPPKDYSGFVDYGEPVPTDLGGGSGGEHQRSASKPTAEEMQAPKIELSKEELRRLELTGNLYCSALSLPFSLNDGQEMSMVVLLPNEPGKLNSMIANLTVETLNEVYRSLSEQQVQVELPKFSIEASHDVKAMLGQLGLTSIFGDSAELDRMFAASAPNKANRQAKVDKIIHKAKITVDEQGAEAAAASMATVVLRSSIKITTPSFIANHPFLYIIRHNRSNMPLFMGVVNRF